MKRILILSGIYVYLFTLFFACKQKEETPASSEAKGDSGNLSAPTDQEALRYESQRIAKEVCVMSANPGDLALVAAKYSCINLQRAITALVEVPKNVMVKCPESDVIVGGPQGWRGPYGISCPVFLNFLRKRPCGLLEPGKQVKQCEGLKLAVEKRVCTSLPKESAELYACEGFHRAVENNCGDDLTKISKEYCKAFNKLDLRETMKIVFGNKQEN